MFKLNRNLLMATLVCSLSVASLGVGAVQQDSSASIDTQIKAQLDAINKAKSLPKVAPRLVAEHQGYKLWTTLDSLDEQWSAGLDSAYNVFSKHLGNPQQTDVVLVRTQQDMATLDKSALSPTTLVLPLNVIEQKGKRNASTAVSALAHEMCHIWLINLVDEKGIAETQSVPQDNALAMKVPVYGHRLVPDWLDETVAVMCEMGELASSRLSKDYEHIPLSRYLAMEHPVYAQIKQTLLAATRKGKSLGTFKVKSEGDDSIDFYYQAAWFKRFLDEHLGERALSQIVDAVAKGISVQDYLLDAFDSQDIDNLSQRFSGFIQTH